MSYRSPALLLMLLALASGAGCRRDAAHDAGTPEATAQLAAGGEHLCFVTTRGEPRCSGRNLDGQLGDGSFADHAFPVAPRGLTRVSKLAAGPLHTCGISSGRLYCWGRNDRGQLGVGDRRNRAVPTRVESLSAVRDVALGDDFTCAVLEGGQVSCFGAFDAGRLGREAREDALVPTSVAGVTDASAVRLGRGHACALVEGGELLCWGDGRAGQLGERTPESRSAPRRLLATDASDAPPIRDITDFDCGGDTTCFLRGGKASCFGASDRGQLGDGTRGGGSGLPAEVPGLAGVEEIHVSAQHVCVRTSEGRVKCWGEGRAGELGRGAYEGFARPLELRPVTGVRAVAVGEGFTCALRGPRTLACTGTSEHGAFGDGENRRLATMIDVVRDLDAATLDAAFEPERASGRVVTSEPGFALGDDHLCALGADGHVRCAGNASGGRLGHASTAQPAAWVDVAVVDDATQVAAHGSMTCVVRASGRVACFGRGEGGLGRPRVVASSVPVPVESVEDAVSVELGASYACILRREGRVSCFGDGSSGQLGNGGTLPSEVPVEVLGATGAVDLALAGTFACAALATGEVRCWGRGTRGQLGAGSSSSPVPVPVPAVRDARRVVARDATACALDAAGSVRCWGEVPFARDARNAGVAELRALRATRSLALGGGFLLALDERGVLRCLGDNRTGACAVDPRMASFVETPTTIADAHPEDPRVEVHATTHGACTRRRSGAVECWGGGGVAEDLLAHAGVPPYVVTPTSAPVARPAP